MNPFLFQSYLKPEWELNIYATPAIITLVLLVIETAFLAVALPETRSKKNSHSKPEAVPKSVPKVTGAKAVPIPVSWLRRLVILKRASKLHFYFLMAFSGITTITLGWKKFTDVIIGVEFTLTFLTYDRMYEVLFA
jgi:hypothetical protein